MRFQDDLKLPQGFPQISLKASLGLAHHTVHQTFKDDRWAIHYYVPIAGYELVTRRDLIPSESDHTHAGNRYYALQLGPLEHKLPPIVAHRWRRVTFIVTTGDRFMEAVEINDLFEQESPIVQIYVKLKEIDIPVEREWWIDDEGTAYIVDLALPVGDSWLPVVFGGRPGRWAALRHQGRAGRLSSGVAGRAAGPVTRIALKRAEILPHR